MAVSIRVTLQARTSLACYLRPFEFFVSLGEAFHGQYGMQDKVFSLHLSGVFRIRFGYEEMMILGSPYEHLVAVNGKSLTTDEEEAEQSKLRDVTSQRRWNRRDKEPRGSPNTTKIANGTIC